MNDTVTRPGAAKVSDRMQAFNAIEEARVADLNKEIAEAGGEKIDFVPTPDLSPAAAGGEDEETEEKGDGGGTVDKEETKKEEAAAPIYEFLGEEALPKTKVKLKVDGVEQEVSVADLVRDHQKAKAADKRLEDASITKRQAEQTLADAKIEAERIKKEAKGSTTAVTDDDGKETKDTPSGKDAIQEAMGLIYEGHQEEAAAILDSEINRRVEAKAGGATVDQAELAGRIKTELSWDSALEKFSQDHAEIATDPELARMFQRNLNEAAKTSTTPSEAIEKATEQVSGWLKKVSGRTDDDESADTGKLRVDSDALAARKADKARSDSVRSSTSTRSPAKAQEERIPTRGDTIAEMKKARGQV